MSSFIALKFSISVLLIKKDAGTHMDPVLYRFLSNELSQGHLKSVVYVEVRNPWLTVVYKMCVANDLTSCVTPVWAHHLT